MGFGVGFGFDRVCIGEKGWLGFDGKGSDEWGWKNIVHEEVEGIGSEGLRGNCMEVGA